MTKDQLKKLISESVRAEVKRYLSVRLPIVLKEIVDMKMEEITENVVPPKKKNSINESVTIESDEDYRSIGTFDSTNLTKLLDFKELGKAGDGLGREFGDDTSNKVYTTVTEAGTEVAIPLSKLPPHVTNMLTKDYSKVMEAMNKRKAQ